MFLDGVKHQLGAFALSAGVDEREVVVHLILSDGDKWHLRGLRVSAPFHESDWGMIFSSPDSTEQEALVVREQDVFKVLFELVPHAAGSIGFDSEAGDS
jgi:hypothetical protein